MKNLLILLSLYFLFSTNLIAQPPGGGDGPGSPFPSSGYLIHFSYDTAGNQIKRFYDPTNYTKQEVVAEIEAEEIDKKSKSKLSFYPNPIENELTITWSKSENSSVRTVQVYSINSKLVRSFTSKNNSQELKLPLHNIASGMYIVKVLFSNGKEDSFKIIKK